MVDVSHKPESLRIARAQGFIKLNPMTLRLISQNKIRKGNVLRIAEVAGIMAAKKTFEMIPLCHNINLTKVEVTLEVNGNGLTARSFISCVGQTGAEMEALHSVTIGLLTVYDMCKAVDKKMVIKNIELIEKIKTPL